MVPNVVRREVEVDSLGHPFPVSPLAVLGFSGDVLHKPIELVAHLLLRRRVDISELVGPNRSLQAVFRRGL